MKRSGAQRTRGSAKSFSIMAIIENAPKADRRGGPLVADDTNWRDPQLGPSDLTPPQAAAAVSSVDINESLNQISSDWKGAPYAHPLMGAVYGIINAVK